MDQLVDANAARYRPGSTDGHYESWFLRANAGDRAFWIRYTVFAPAGDASAAIGELWAIWSERCSSSAGEERGGNLVAVKSELPIGQCEFATTGLAVRIGDATLDDKHLRGEAEAHGHRIAWDLRYGGGRSPLLLLPARLYATRLPRAKALVPQPLAKFTGTITIDGEPVEIADWVGSQNHNWGSRHTDRYAWGQVAGFDEAPDAFLECSTARIKVGPIWTPPLSPVVLQLGGETLAWNGLVQTARALGAYAPYQWHLESTGKPGKIDIRIRTDAHDVVALRYGNPPGGSKICLNSKLAYCEVTVERKGRLPVVLHSDRAAFEILEDAAPPGVVPVV